MARVYTSVDELIGGTPLLELKGLERKHGLGARVLAKLEYFNPAGSVKDRVARNMLDEAEKSGALKPGGTVVVTLSSTEPVHCAAVPPNAVVMDMKGAFVWLLGPGNVAEKRYVNRGPIVQGMQTIVTGVKPGERIVADGVHKVSKGVTVEPFAGK